MGLRNQLIRQQLANSDARRALGFGLAGAPELLGVVDLFPSGQIRMTRDSNLQNKLELGDWLGITLSGLAGTAVRSIAVFPSGAYTLIATVQGLAADFTEGYFSVLAASFRRPASGDEVIVGVSTKLFEATDVVGGTSSISGAGNGGISINYNSGQVIKQYTWSFKYIAISNVNA